MYIGTAGFYDHYISIKLFESKPKSGKSLFYLGCTEIYNAVAKKWIKNILVFFYIITFYYDIILVSRY